MAVSPGCRAACVSLACLLLFGLSLPAVAQQILYEYDTLGRLILVSTPEGVAMYEYDPVGNILRIVTRRYADTADPLAILMVNPTKGAAGTEVHIYGKGFATAPGDNQVAFNGTAAIVSAATTTRLLTTVPAGATTGPLTVTVGTMTATAPEPFTVLSGFAVVPEQADVALGGTLGFQATLGGSPTSAVAWRVNGVVGGSAQLGTITSAGLYTAPSTPPPVQPILVEAVLTADPTQGATATVRVVGQVAGLIAASPVTVGSATARSAQAISGPVTVGVTQATEAQTISGPITVAVTQAAAAQSLAGPVSVAVAQPTGAQALSGPLSVTGGSVVTGLAPATGGVGTVLGVTLTGANLQGASLVRFLRNGSLDTTVTAASVDPAADGTSLTFTLSISASAATGPRVVQVVTPQGTSTNFDLGTNTFTVQP